MEIVTYKYQTSGVGKLVTFEHFVNLTKEFFTEGFFMNFEQKFERFVMCALIGFLLIFAISAGLGTKDARTLLSMYAFFIMGLYIFRGWYFKHPYDKIEIVGCALVGITLNALNYFS